MPKKKSTRGMLKVRSASSRLLTTGGNQLRRDTSSVLDNPRERFDYFYKLIIIGDESVGKSNLLQRVCNGRFVQTPKTTYGVEYEAVTLPLPGTNQRVKAQVWDTSGAKQFLAITTIHYRYAVGAFLIYDVTDRSSFESLPDWLAKIREFSDEHVQIVLVGNKLDKIAGAKLVPSRSKTIFDPN